MDFVKYVEIMGNKYIMYFPGNGRRKQTERIECLVYLCARCHRLLHDTGLNNKELKRQSQQELLNQGYTEDEVREIDGGKLY